MRTLDLIARGDSMVSKAEGAIGSGAILNSSLCRDEEPSVRRIFNARTLPRHPDGDRPLFHRCHQVLIRRAGPHDVRHRGVGVGAARADPAFRAVTAPQRSHARRFSAAS